MRMCLVPRAVAVNVKVRLPIYDVDARQQFQITDAHVGLPHYGEASSPRESAASQHR